MTVSDTRRTATFISTVESWNNARLYKLDPPTTWTEYLESDEQESREVDHVIVSAVDAFGSGPETYIFPATAEGDELSMLEMDGSFRGEKNFEKALERAGYEVIGLMEPTNSVFDRAYEAVREFQEHPQGMFVNTSRGRELGMMNGGATAAMRVMLAHLQDTAYMTADDYGDTWRVVNADDIDALVKELGDVE